MAPVRRVVSSTATSSRTRCIKADSPTTSSCLGRSTFRQVYLARIKSPPLVPPQPVNTNAPNWIPFALTSASQFRPSAPPALTSRRYADDLNETRALGELTSPYRSAIDDETARWHTELAQFQLNRIARAEVAADGRDLLAHARLFALLNLALADAATSVFDAKYAYLFWRPVTAIRNADLDDNARTDVDPGWSPF